MTGRLRYDLAGRVVAVTGGAQGIGRALAEQLLARGAVVAILDRDAAALDACARDIASGRLHPLVADVTDREGTARALGDVVDRLGGLDVVVANAGVTPPPATLRTMDLRQFDRVVDINLTGVLNTVQPAVESIISRRGHVLVVSSCAAFSPGVAGSAYMASKAAAEQVGRALRLELAPYGVSVGVGYFGFVDTRLARATLDEDPLGRQVGELLSWPLNRRIEPEPAAQALVRSIERRSPRVVAPRVWAPYSALRGVANPVIDAALVRSPRVLELVRRIDAAGRSSVSTRASA